jgi:hypothetical protein
LIQQGVAQLIVHDAVLQSADFDASYGNSEGAVRVVFLHPLRVHNLSVTVRMTIAPNGDELQASVPVTTDPQRTEDFDGVAQQRVEQEPLSVYPHEPGAN